jgi:ketosteroid isomerase-like protein
MDIFRQTSRSVANALLIVAVSIIAPVEAAEDAAVAATVMQLARAQWAAEMAGKPAAEQHAATAEDYSEFNPVYPVRIDGKAMAVAMTGADTSTTPLFADMQNARVQVYGDTAILSYNFAGLVKDKDGKIAPNIAKSTRVYAKTGGGWKLVHANFAPVVTPD